MLRIWPHLPILAFIAIAACNATHSDENIKPVNQAGIATKPLLNAHAHNDYLHERPLVDALSHGFTSVEADVFLVDEQLLVAHSFIELSPSRTLEDLYLKPIEKLVAANNGRVYRDGPPLTLLVDIKANGKQAYAALDALLKKYDPIVSQSIDGKYSERAVTVIVSGDRPFSEIEHSNPRRAGIDGRLSDLHSQQPADLLPLLSDRWSSHFSYRGIGDFTAAEQAKLRDIANQTHSAGRRLRFWATPENPMLWKHLQAAGVDLIGTDDLAALSRFLQQ